MRDKEFLRAKPSSPEDGGSAAARLDFCRWLSYFDYDIVQGRHEEAVKGFEKDGLFFVSRR